MNIGFFDSGLGGLTILKAVSAFLPQYDYSYFGDTENLPYGDKTEEQVFELTKAGIIHLFESGSKMVIIACNTASAETLRKLQDNFLTQEYPDRKILGVIVPTVEEVIKVGIYNVALIATKRTIDSSKYDLEFNNRSTREINLISIATPELVPLIELGDVKTAAQQAIKRIDEEGGESAAIILGCTHYTQIKNELRSYYGDKKIIFSQDEIIPEKLSAYLTNHPEIEREITKTGERKIHLSKHRPDYDQIMSQMLGGVFLPH